MKEPNVERAGELVEPWIPRLKKERGPFKSDDDLLLAAFYQPPVLEELYAVRDAPGRRTDYPLPALTPLKQLMNEVEKRPTLKYVSVKKGDFNFEIEGPASQAVAAE